MRFVQIFVHGQIWDNHESIQKNLVDCCRKTDQPSAALVKDLKARGLLDTTIVHWGGEIGRLPVTENHGAAEKAGRDHNGQGFTSWLAGGGVKGGMVYGATDEFGHKAVLDKVSPTDYHATLLHLFGLDHTKLIYRYNGRNETRDTNAPRGPRILRNPLCPIAYMDDLPDRLGYAFDLLLHIASWMVT